MPLLTDGFKEVAGILKDLASGVKAAVQYSENERKIMRDAIAETVELIDATLTILKQHLTKVVSELKFGDRKEAKQQIYELGDFQGWEDKFRKFQLCESLHLAAEKMNEKGIYKLLNKVNFSDPEAMHYKMSDYIGGEINAARTIAKMLQDLSQLADSVDTDSDGVVKELETARNEVGKWRQSFIDLELEIRNSI